MRVPAEVYAASARKYEGTPADIDYGVMATRKVQPCSGVIGYRKEKIMITPAVAGWSVGLSPQPNGLVEVWSSKLLLGHIDPKTSSFQAARPGRLEAGQSEVEKCNL